MPTPYVMPRYGTDSRTLHAWLMQAVTEGEAWLQTQRPTQNWDQLIELLSSPDGSSADPLSGQSNVGYNKSKRIGRELVAALSNFRHEGEIAPVADRDLYSAAHVLTTLDHEWSELPQTWNAHRMWLQNGVLLGTGYIYEEWDRNFHGPFKGDIRLSALRPDQVTFIQLPQDHDIQRAYMVILRFELPINLAKSIYEPTNKAFADSLVPDRSSPGWIQKGLRKVQEWLSPALRVAGRQKYTDTSFPTVDIFHAYILDQSINNSPFPLTLGAPGSNWSYQVPALGDPIPLSTLNPETNQPLTRPAVDADCRMFPLRRFTIWARSTDIIAYDGSSPWWHGAAPVARVKFNDLPWEALGASLIGDTITIQTGIQALMQGIENSAAARLDPPMIYDDTFVSSTWAQAFNPAKAGVRGAAPLSMGDIVKFPVPIETYDVPQWIPEWIASQEQRMDYLTGVTDMIAISKAKQIPSADTLEKLLEMAGPIVQDMVRAVEEPLQQLGTWRLALYFQFYNYPRLMQAAGAEAAALSVQFTPDLLVPLQSNEPHDQYRNRQKRMLHEFKYVVTQSGINEINRMTTKLFYLQIMQRGFPISWWTFAKIAQIPNFGPPPEDTYTEMEMWVAQQHIVAEIQADVQKELLESTGQLAPGGTAGGATGAAGGTDTPMGHAATPGGAPKGRPPSNNAPPRLQSKDGGSRSTVTTSR